MKFPAILALPLAAALAGCGGGGGGSNPPPPPPIQTTYTNPLTVSNGAAVVDNCPDPSVIRGQSPDTNWYAYCTGDPLNEADRAAGRFRKIPILRSSDLVTWQFVGEVFSTLPAWIATDSGLWAPSIEFFGGTYYLYYSVTRTAATGSFAIGVATSTSPTGPWSDAGAPAVESQPPRAVIDPDVVEVNGERYIFYGSFGGGISVRRLGSNGLTSDPASETQVAAGDRYEASYVLQRNGLFYLFLSANGCCNGALSGYGVFVGRSQNIIGPYVDANGVSLLDARAGGTPVMTANGNRWVGPGHNALLTDFDSHDWFVYAAIDRNQPFFSGQVGFTRRPILLDPLDWQNGWPVVRGGHGPSATAIAKPAAQPGQTTAYVPSFRQDDQPGTRNDFFGNEFDVTRPDWQWAGTPNGAAVNGEFVMTSQDAELFEGSNSASIFSGPLPTTGDYLVETSLTFDLPATGNHDFAQAGLVILRDADNYIKLVHSAIGASRQTEFAKEVPAPAVPRYGSSSVGPPGDITLLRIVKRTVAGEELYTAYTSTDGTTWTRGGTWTHSLGPNARVGLVAMNRSGFTARFDYVRVYAVQ